MHLLEYDLDQRLTLLADKGNVASVDVLPVREVAVAQGQRLVRLLAVGLLEEVYEALLRVQHEVGPF